MSTKNRTLYVLKFLWEQTDEENPARTTDITEYLAKHDIIVNIRTIAADIEQLEEFGFDIICTGSSPKRFFIGQRFLELPELMMLIDAVESSRFTSENKSRKLINKLHLLSSQSQSRNLNRHIYADKYLKADNKLLYYTIDTIHKSINSGQRIRFKYIEYMADKKKVHKHNGFVYEFSPYALLWHNEYYYVLGYSEKHQSIAKFRVDRIDKANMIDMPAVKKPKDFDPSAYLKNIFSMYDGKMQSMRLKCDADMMRVIIDRFGAKTKTAPSENNRFIADVKVSVSPTFYGWLFGFGGKIQIYSPKSARDDYIKQLKAALSSEL